MTTFGALERQIATLRELLGYRADDLARSVRSLDDGPLLELVRASAGLVRDAQRISTVAVAVVAERSTRNAGQDGLAQKRGHRNATDLLQTLTGESRSSAHRQIRVGAAVLEGAPVAVSHKTPRPWHAPLGDGVVGGRISVAQSDAIRTGLGAPPPVTTRDVDAARVVIATRAIETGGMTGRRIPLGVYPAELCAHTYIVTPDEASSAAEAPIQNAWNEAAAQLTDEAPMRTVEELRAQARLMRDRLDPDGAERRFQQRFEARSFRRWTSADGLQHGSIVFDDEGAAELAAIFDTALRPRRGGPRFVDAHEAEQARALVDDPRTNDQLAYDLLLDLVGAGTKADAAAVLGTRQPGVRVVTVTKVPGATYAEDGLVSLPDSVVQQRVCNTGTVSVELDETGDPLNVGRARRLFTASQRIALGIRDGGCRWLGCDRPASYCEAHHIDPYAAGGRTDIDRGILLCRFHHMQLHHGGWRITREARQEFVLHSPTGVAKTLTTRLALRRAFAHVDPPPPRFRATVRTEKRPPDG